MSKYYKLNEDKSVSPCTLFEWGEQHELMTVDTKRIGRDEVKGLIVSTVWLGLDHNLLNEFDETIDNPHIFETMVFKNDESLDYCDRYSSYDEALEGHKKAIEWVKDGCNEDDTKDADQ